MANYNNAIQTKAGIELSNELIAGLGKLEFTCLKTGSGTYTENEKKRESIQEMTELKECRQTFYFSGIIPQDEDYIQLKVYATNLDLEEGYNLTELGIYARMSDSEDEILYCVITTETADYMPVYDGKIYEITFRFLIKVFDIENVQIQYKNESYALAEDLMEHMEQKSNPHEVNAGQIPFVSIQGETNVQSALSKVEKMLGSTEITEIGDGTITDAICTLNNKIQTVKVGSETTELNNGDFLFVTEELPMTGAAYSNITISEVAPSGVTNWGMITGDLVVSEAEPSDATFFAKIE